MSKIMSKMKKIGCKLVVDVTKKFCGALTEALRLHRKSPFRHYSPN